MSDLLATEPPALARIVDFHAHWLPSELAGRRPPTGLSGRIAELWPLLTDVSALLEAIERDGVQQRLFSAPLEMLQLVGESSLELARRSNDLLAELIAAHGPRLGGLATIDAFSGEAGAEEARRAVDELGFSGLFTASVSGQLLLDAPEARPTLEFAAERGVPVFAHPVNPPLLEQRFAAVPGAGHALGRATESAISTLALLRSGILSELPGLSIVIAQLGSVSLLLAHYLDGTDATWEDAPAGWKPSDDRARLFVDTAGFEPIAIRAALDAVGVAHVLLGSDWPVDVELSPVGAATALRTAGVADHDLDRIAAGNALGLLGESESVRRAQRAIG
jgi:predicted TIM-barrel fold metal-dependent hydrolase